MLNNNFIDLLEKKNNLWPNSTLIEIHESGKEGKNFIKDFLSYLITDQSVKRLFFPRAIYNFSSFQEWEDVKKVNWNDSNWKEIFLSGEDGQSFYIAFRDWFFQNSHIPKEQQEQVEKMMFFDRMGLIVPEIKETEEEEVIKVVEFIEAEEIVEELAEIIPIPVINPMAFIDHEEKEEVIVVEERKKTTSYLATHNNVQETLSDRFQVEKEYPWLRIEDWIFAKKSIPEWKDLSYAAMKNFDKSSKDFAKAFMAFSTKKYAWSVIGRDAHRYVFKNKTLNINWDEYSTSIELKVEMEEFALRYVDDYQNVRDWKIAKCLVFQWQGLSRQKFESFNKNSKEFLMLFSIWASESFSEEMLEKKIDALFNNNTLIGSANKVEEEKEEKLGIQDSYYFPELHEWIEERMICPNLKELSYEDFLNADKYTIEGLFLESAKDWIKNNFSNNEFNRILNMIFSAEKPFPSNYIDYNSKEDWFKAKNSYPEWRGLSIKEMGKHGPEASQFIENCEKWTKTKFPKSNSKGRNNKRRNILEFIFPVQKHNHRRITQVATEDYCPYSLFTREIEWENTLQASGLNKTSLNNLEDASVEFFEAFISAIKWFNTHCVDYDETREKVINLFARS